MFKPICLDWMLHLCEYCSIQFTRTGMGEWKGKRRKERFGSNVLVQGSCKSSRFFEVLLLQPLCLILTTVTPHPSLPSPEAHLMSQHFSLLPRAPQEKNGFFQAYFLQLLDGSLIFFLVGRAFLELEDHNLELVTV